MHQVAFTRSHILAYDTGCHLGGMGGYVEFAPHGGTNVRGAHWQVRVWHYGVISVLDTSWEVMLIGVASEGAADLTGSMKGWQTQSENKRCARPFIAYGVETINSILSTNSLFLPWTLLLFRLSIGLVGCQVSSLLSEGTLPVREVHTTLIIYSLHLGVFFARYIRHEEQVFTFIAEEDEEFGEDNSLWMRTLVLKRHFTVMCRAISKMQGKTFLTCAQARTLVDLRRALVACYGITSDLDEIAVKGEMTWKPSSLIRSLAFTGGSLATQSVSYSIKRARNVEWVWTWWARLTISSTTVKMELLK